MSFSVMAGCDGPVCSGEIISFAEALKVSSDEIMISVNDSVDRKVLSCELISDKFIALPTSSKNADAMYSLLLTAFAANAQVNLEFNPASKQCEIGSIELIPSK
ncbi:hypothetical protein [Rheinheimera salexigens]|uniref:Uncharacterized protein n=1 Tax=Rheinheimera salexigens TaxID=1628148 RepID=A0A1E7Q9A2_9GAMM|nr:hypothetical protein [Rheinheimera salexigens]OEY70588.1 hypothetical protein BI198_14195 [Rheinheimera salexigens]